MFEAGDVANGFNVQPALNCWDKNFRENIISKVVITVKQADAQVEAAAKEKKAESMFNDLQTVAGDEMKTYDMCMEVGMIGDEQASNTTSYAGKAIEFCTNFTTGFGLNDTTTFDEMAADPKRSEGFQTMANHALTGAIGAMDNTNATDFGEDQIDKALNLINYQVSGGGMSTEDKNNMGKSSVSKGKKKVKKMALKKAKRIANKLKKIQKKLAAMLDNTSNSTATLDNAKCNRLNMKLASAQQEAFRAVGVNLPAGRSKSISDVDGTVTITKISPTTAKKGKEMPLKTKPSGGSKKESGMTIASFPKELESKEVVVVVQSNDFKQFTTNYTTDSNVNTTANATTPTNSTSNATVAATTVEGSGTQTGTSFAVISRNKKGEQFLQTLTNFTGFKGKPLAPCTACDASNASNATTNGTQQYNLEYFNETTGMWAKNGINQTTGTTDHCTVFTYTQPQTVPTTIVNNPTPTTTSDENKGERIYMHFVLYFMILIDVMLIFGILSHCIFYLRDKKRINAIKEKRQTGTTTIVMATAMTSRTDDIKIEELKDAEDKSTVSVIPMNTKADDESVTEHDME